MYEWYYSRNDFRGSKEKAWCLMPIYVYSCQKCYKEIEKILPITDETKEIICDCGNQAIKIVAPISNFSVSGYAFKNGYSDNTGH
jgi:putative FmdB family regulatory protein